MLNKSVVAVTSFSTVAYRSKYANNPDDWWMGTIAHEQRHRSDIDDMGGLGFDGRYLAEAAANFGDETKMLTEIAGYKNDKYGKQLWNYNNGEAANIFQGNFTKNQQATMLESLGSRFKRDVILKDRISDATSLINNTTNIINGLNSTTDKGLILALNGLISRSQQTINNAKQEQTNITNQYGK